MWAVRKLSENSDSYFFLWYSTINKPELYFDHYCSTVQKLYLITTVVHMSQMHVQSWYIKNIICTLKSIL